MRRYVVEGGYAVCSLAEDKVDAISVEGDARYLKEVRDFVWFRKNKGDRLSVREG